MSKLFYDYFLREGMSLDREYIIFNIIVDDGSETIALYNYFPNARIYAFEGDATAAPVCATNLAPYADRITFTATATTDYDGTMLINGQEVPCARLDTFIINNGISRVDFLLINHKTGVLQALKGLGDYLPSVQYLYSLITYYEVFTGQVIECNDFLLARDFTTMDVINMNYWSDTAMYRNNRFDVVCHLRNKPADLISTFITKSIANIRSLHTIYFIVPDASGAEIQTLVESANAAKQCKIINESAFPFSYETVNAYFPDTPQIESYYRQLLHLYAWKIIPGLTGRHLIAEAETIFTLPTIFIVNRTNLYNYTSELNAGVFQQMAALHPFFKRANEEKSGEVYYEMMEHRHLAGIFALTEYQHNTAFYNAYLNCIPSFITRTASEYELYFNYLQLSGYTNYDFAHLDWRFGTISEVDSATDVNYLVIG